MDINMIGICKAFGTNKVLGGVNLHIRPGEVHALMGENGAGKSTLMNILTGIHKADAGTILVDGKEVTFRNNKDAEEHGIAFIHQELNIWPNLSILENLFLMNQPKTAFGFIDFKKMRQMAEEKCQEQSPDMRPVYVGICHDEYLVVEQFVFVEVIAYATAQRKYDVAYCFAAQDLFEACFFDVQYLSAKRQNSLKYAVAALFGCSAGRVSFHDEYFALCSVFIGTIRQLSGKPCTR